MTNVNPSLKERRDAFYEWAQNELHYTTEEVRTILIANGYTSFSGNDIYKYRSALKYAAGVRDGVAEKLAKSRELAQQYVSAVACPIPECEGTIRERGYHETGWGKTCTKGGDAHVICWRTANIAVSMNGAGGRTVEEMALVLLNERRANIEEKEKGNDQDEGACPNEGLAEIRDIPELQGP